MSVQTSLLAPVRTREGCRACRAGGTLLGGLGDGRTPASSWHTGAERVGCSGFFLPSASEGEGHEVLQKGNAFEEGDSGKRTAHMLGWLPPPSVGDSLGTPNPLLLRGRSGAGPQPGSHGTPLPSSSLGSAPTAAGYKRFPHLRACRELWHRKISAIGRGSVFKRKTFC